ncbi:hypothetical protein [Winogradskyella flava]|uniref:Uncharacterized protein n=1 Tax=Winogradskyella flava TaxID=1884876 RepID=A0A842IX49_9FLAO|nr:hypothetical protein [Winogradskyella flava]MBC2846689.1 hypothetical protein [Winogradskyella flava]
MKRILIVLVFTISSHNVLLSQDSSKFVKYPDNIDNPLTTEEKGMIIDAYGEQAANKYIFNIPQRLKNTKHILRNRFEIVEIKNKDLSKLKKLSDVPLFNVYKKNKRDKVVDIKNFNPLKYQFHFYSKEAEYVRIDDTSYVIIIKSQFQ